MNKEDYILSHIDEEDIVLKELSRETYLKILMPRMLSGHLQGKILEHISKMIKPKKILEIGTFTGYSAICLAKGLLADGVIHTIEINDELKSFAEKYFEKAGIKKNVKQHIGNALEIIPELDHKFDLVFIDADKPSYLDYYKLVMKKVNKGGYIIADNIFWDDKVFNPHENNDKYTKGIIEFNDFVHKDKSVENVIMPVRDGLMIIRKII